VILHRVGGDPELVCDPLHRKTEQHQLRSFSRFDRPYDQHMPFARMSGKSAFGYANAATPEQALRLKRSP